MSNLTKTKREELIEFIRKQMEGPGGCNDNFTIKSEDLTSEDEVINTTPGSIYSTAILFPKRKMKTEEDAILDAEDETEDDVSEDNEMGDESTSSEREDLRGSLGIDADDEDIYSLNRRFPNMVGISCCLDKNADLRKDVTITVCGRYYTKITGANRTNVQVIVKKDCEEFEKFFNDNKCLHEDFSYSDGRLTANRLDKRLTEIRDALKSINLEYARKVSNKHSSIQLNIEDRYRYLSSCREKLFTSLSKLNSDRGYLSEEEKRETLQMLKEIETYECFLSYFEDLADMYSKKSYGFWQSHTFTKKIDLFTLDDNESGNKAIFSPNKNDCLKDVLKVEINDRQSLALALWLQKTINSKDENDKDIYLKVLLQNTSTPFEEDKKHYFSIVTEGVNKLSFFGIKIGIESNYLKPYHGNGTYKDVTKEEDKLDFLYRDIKDYGVGHFCSVDWEYENGNVRRVFSEFIPSYETPDIEPIPRDKYSEYVDEKRKLMPPPFLSDSRCLQFKWLSTLSVTTNSEIREALLELVEQYHKWIAKIEAHVSDKDKSFARVNTDACRKDYQRMKTNVEKILSGEENMLAFRLMNTAMFMQLWHANKKSTLDTRRLPVFDEDFYRNANDDIFHEGEHASWRPFQLAFILLNLDGIVRHPDDEGWKKRNECADLVWFPTGGGKTEAYLGIIALCIIIRRRTHRERGYGVTAIMRYTLRLLTNQQFQRALNLIMALEEIRMWQTYDLGTDEISIGLYVGANSLPNQHSRDNNPRGLVQEATCWNNRLDGENKTKIPLDRCPWCGSRLEFVEDKFRCTGTHCKFDDHGLPVRLCDEDIYKCPPTLLFGTVDKFASIAHKVSGTASADSRRLFGRRSGGTDVLPPDLIIQDELHLLLGPLGSAVSLFECAIDQLCTREDGTRPKIISSTATTRNTELQIRALYDRGLNIFPKNGVDYDDSFFAFYKRSGEDHKFESKRKYLGIMPTGRTQMTTQMRLAAILFVHRALFEMEHIHDEGYERVADNYFSVISYFNSLKEVGKTDAEFYIEYVKYLRRLFKRVLRSGDLLECFYARDLKETEISGRLSAGEVNKAFTTVATHWSLNNRLPHKEGDNWAPAITPPDYILATNMISVGLDVNRFNTIIMNSMPRNIAEYIQASSRVARNVQGLVITLHNPFRSRDVSHFEKYREFHEKLYYYVEPISITPFSKKSVEKYFSLYLASLIRHCFIELAENADATRINDNGTRLRVREKVMRYIKQRFDRTQALTDELQKGLLTDELRENIERYVDNALNEWSEKANHGLVYKANPFRMDGQPYLFIAPDAYEDERTKSLWTVPTSLRIVEPEAALHVKVR